MRPYNVDGSYTRDFPYDWQFLVENVMDPSHIPFAHHGLQGDRSDALPIEVDNVCHTQRGYEFSFKDRTMGRKRSGISKFQGPYLVDYVSQFENSSSTFNLTILCIPREPGSSRAIVLSTSSARPSLFKQILTRVPVWFVHLYSSRFLESDLLYLHHQDLQKQKGDRSYIMPAECDKSIVALRKTLKEYEYSPVVAQTTTSLPREQLLDRWNTHVLQCRHCSDAYVRLVKGRLVAMILSAFAMLVGFMRLSICSLIAAGAMECLRQRFHSVDFQYSKM
jgi:phenylpropionate dioxygenase-like ring-hydroxylating dioxygenase large terminal subunit